MLGRDPHRYYRRHARRSLRRGTLPVMLIGTGEPVGLIALAAISKWLFRHRSAFLPFTVTAAAFILAAVIHRHHRHYWIAALAITSITAIILGIPQRIIPAHPSVKFIARIISRAWRTIGIDRPAERAYVTTVIAVCGGWLTAAIADGPTMKPLPSIALIATVGLGIPWWAHRRRRARVRAIRTMQAWPGLAGNMGLPDSKIASIVIDAWGWTGRLILRKGTTAAQAVSQLPAIESGLGIQPGTARVTPDPARADRAIIRVIEKDPHAQPIPWKPPVSVTIKDPMDLGLREDGEKTLANILRRNVLIGGMTGAGKSGIENNIQAKFAQCPDVEPWGIDMKAGMELQPWADTIYRLATTPAQAIALLAEGIAELDRRAAILTALGLRTWEPTPDDPAIVILIDEYAELPPDARDHADSIARRGRAPAVNLIIATQRPTQAAMGGNAVRSQMDVRICLRVRERRDTDLILGAGSLAAGWDAHALTLPGTFYLSDPEHTIPMRARAYEITDAQVRAHAARHAIPGRTRRPAATPSPASPAQPPRTPPQSPQDSPDGTAGTGGHPRPQTALWDALVDAGPDGVSVAELETACGMARRWVYYRLNEHAQAGRAILVRRGYWRAVRPGDPPPAPTRHPQ
jgi:S-DNA-T family DNA segregation ATPase FtsK/SpoIIIE